MAPQLPNAAFCAPVPLPSCVSVAYTASSFTSRRPTFPTSRRIPHTLNHFITTPKAADGDVTVTHNPTTSTTNAVVTSPSKSTSIHTDDSVINVSNSELNGVSTDCEDNEFPYSVEEISHLIDTVQNADLADFRFQDGDFVIEITRPGGFGFDSEGRLNPAPTPSKSITSSSSNDSGNVEYVEEYIEDDDNSNIDVLATETNDDNSSNNSNSSIIADNDADNVRDTDFIVTSNRVGFFFCGAKNKPPLVNVGDTVAYNQPVCIIEQLGQQYVYLSEAAGKVVKVLVEDGDAVEYGSKVMIIRPD